MIVRLHIGDVFARAAERGYTPAQIQPCLVRDLGDGWYEVDVKHPAYPHANGQLIKPPDGLGDIVAKWLAAVGITKARVSAAIGGDCGCQQRQQKLNELGRKIGIG